jgi:hypothetical protein
MLHVSRMLFTLFRARIADLGALPRYFLCKPAVPGNVLHGEGTNVGTVSIELYAIYQHTQLLFQKAVRQAGIARLDAIVQSFYRTLKPVFPNIQHYSSRSARHHEVLEELRYISRFSKKRRRFFLLIYFVSSTATASISMSRSCETNPVTLTRVLAGILFSPPLKNSSHTFLMIAT